MELLIFWGVLLCFLFAIPAFSFFSTPIERDEDNPETSFLYSATRKILPLSFAAANCSAAGLVALAGAVSAYGYGSILIPVSFLVGIIVFRGLLYDKDFLTISSIVDKFYGNSQQNQKQLFRSLYIVSQCFLLIFFLSWELYMGSKLLTEAIYGSTNLTSQFIIGFMVCITVTVYGYFGGYSSVVKTDAIQLAFCSILLYLLLFSESTAIGTLDTPFYESKLDPSQILIFFFTLFLLNIIYQPQNPATWHIRNSAGNSNKSTDRILFFGCSFLSILWLVVIFSALHSTNPFAIFSSFSGVDNYLWIGALSAVLLSTVDTQTFTLLGLIDQMLKPENYRLNKKPPSSPLKKSKNNVMAVPIIMIFSLTFSLILMRYSPNIYTSLLSASGCLGVYFPAILMSILRKKNEWNYTNSHAVALFVIFVSSAIWQTALMIYSPSSTQPLLIIVGTIFCGLVVAAIPSRTHGVTQLSSS